MTPPAIDQAGQALVDVDHEISLLRDGFVVVPMLAPDAVVTLSEMYREVVPQDDHGLTVDYMRPDRAVMRALRDLLAPLWAEALPRLFVGHAPVMTTFVVKHPGHESGMFLHEDRSYVDESRARAYTVWVPLTDVGPGLDNGGLELVPASHRLARSLGGSHTPDLFRPYERFLRERLVPVTASAGQAVVYDTRTLHASGPNLTGEPRLAVVCAVAPVEEPLVHVVATDRTHRRVHRVTPDFFVEHHPRDIEQAMPADCPVVAEYDEEPVLTPAQVAMALGSEVPPLDPVVAERCRRPGDPQTFGSLPWRDEPVGSAPHRRRRHRRSPLVTISSADGEVGIDGDTLTVAAGATGEIAVASGRGVEVIVKRASAVAAGLRSSDRAFTFEPGRAVRLTGGGAYTVWNDGPGPTELDVVPARRRPFSGR